MQLEDVRLVLQVPFYSSTTPSMVAPLGRRQSRRDAYLVGEEIWNRNLPETL